MIVDIDAGNTRIKWRVLGSELRADGLTYDQDWQTELARLSYHGPVRQVRVCSVRGKAFNRVLQDVCVQSFAVAPIFAEVNAGSCGLKPAYQDLSQLGVDRWLSMLAAFRRAQGACVVASLGTAITLDYIDSSGCHLGGYIVPGIGLMAASLSEKTHAINLHDHFMASGTCPGVDTHSCVNNGLSLMIRLFFEHTFCESSMGHAVPSVFVSGGDAQVLEKVLSSRCFTKVYSAPDLIFDGLDLAVPQLRV